ncbi:MAG: RnfABCDGE type electron transport complex subunit G [Spirochaetales bacterium]|jgi:RnfABCDGE-type electron transport complex G subunit|nr:RnfABCDGE type electron transport complex subunit G [Spirochaetales bacterium]
MNNMINISSGPHVRDRWSTRFIMVIVFLSLMPATIVGVLVHGLHALLIIVLAIVSAVGTEFLFDVLCHKGKSYLDGSAAVTGLLLALSLSPDTPLFAPVIGSIFAILVVKCCFGGLGKNFINPALAGRCFLLISFSNSMTVFKVDMVSSATPVAELLAGRAVNVTSMFLGTSNAVIGSSIAALLLGGLILWAFDIIHGEICFSVLGSFTLFVALFGGQGFDPVFLAANICGGGVVMGAFFMATDYVTSPVSKLGQMIYGLIIGVLGGLFRIFGSSADSFSYAILMGNLFTPLIDMYILPKPFAYRKKAIARQNGQPKLPFSKRIPKSVLVIALITLLAGAALGGVFKLTEERIKEQKEKAAWQSYQAVVPQAVSFRAVAAPDIYGKIYGSSFGRSTINEAVIGMDADGKTVGYAISVTSSEGYDGNITISVGIAADGTVNSIAFTELHETPGKGMLAADASFKDQFNGRAVTSFKLLTTGSVEASNGIDCISGATVTSKAIVNAVNAALDFYNNAKGVQ